MTDTKPSSAYPSLPSRSCACRHRLRTRGSPAATTDPLAATDPLPVAARPHNRESRTPPLRRKRGGASPERYRVSETSTITAVP